MAPQLLPAQRLDEATKSIGRRGIAKARAALTATRPDPDLASLKRADTARQAMGRAAKGGAS